MRNIDLPLRVKRGTELLLSGLLALSAGGCAGESDPNSVTDFELVALPDSKGTAESAAPLALSRNGATLWAVSTDTDRVAVLDTRRGRLLASLPVGKRPQSVALDPEGRFAYVANSSSDDVSVIDVRKLEARNYRHGAYERRITTGAGPESVLVSSDGRHVYVANSGQDTITVLSAHDQHVEQVLALRDSACNVDDRERHFQPRGLALSGDGRRLYITRFLSQTRPGGVQRSDYGKEGLLCRVELGHREPRFTAIRLAPTDTGFVDRNGQMTGAFPNQLQSVVLRDGHAYLPNIAASPSGPLGFDVDTQAYVNRVDDVDGTPRDAGALNLHLGARDPEPGNQELYFANPRSIAFTTGSGKGTAYVVAAASDVLVKLNVDAEGTLGFTGDADTTRYIDLNDPDAVATTAAKAGKNPVGIVIEPRGRLAYVLNRVSRNVSVVDLARDRVDSVIAIEDLPIPGTMDEVLLVGSELFSSSRGNFARTPDVAGSTRDRLSEKGHQACTSCHPDGLTDGVVWQFASGPRKTISINGTTNPRRRNEQRIINASAIFDELEDVDFNTRRVSGPEPLAMPRPCFDDTSSGVLQATNDPDHGLILGNERDLTLAPCVLVPFAVPNENRPELRVQLPGSPTLIEATDALKEWQRQSVATPNRPLTNLELALNGVSGGGLDAFGVVRGRELFEQVGCPRCHGGAQWTTKIKDFVSPPDASEIATEAAAPGANASQYLHRFLTEVGSFDLNVAGGANTLLGYPAIGGVEKDSNERNALGFDYDGDGKGSGYNTPSLLGGFGSPPYFHNGACETYGCVLSSVGHRRAGLAAGARDPLDDAKARRALAVYLETIDVQTRPHRPKASAAEVEE